MVKIKLDCSKIPKEKIFIGKKGKYIGLILFENRDGEDEYGNLGFVAVDTTKEERDAGEKGAIVGNWREIGGKKAPAPQQRPQSQGRRPGMPQRPAPDPDLDAPEEEIPF